MWLRTTGSTFPPRREASSGKERRMQAHEPFALQQKLLLNPG